MHLHQPEVLLAASHMPRFSEPSEPYALLAAMSDALRTLPERERAPAWELVVRHYGHNRAVEQSAAELALDRQYAEELLQKFSAGLGNSPDPPGDEL